MDTISFMAEEERKKENCQNMSLLHFTSTSKSHDHSYVHHNVDVCLPHGRAKASLRAKPEISEEGI